MMKQVLSAATLLFAASTACADTNYSLFYHNLDVSLSIGTISASGTGSGFSGQFTHTFDNGIGFLGSYSTMTGDVANADWSLTSTTVGIGYELVNNLSENSGVSVIAGLGRTSIDGSLSNKSIPDFIVTGTDEYASALLNVNGRLNDAISFSAVLNANLDINIDPTFAMSLNREVTETGALSIGYSSISNFKDGAKTKVSGWTIGWTNSF